jgi:hypothetical protein
MKEVFLSKGEHNTRAEGVCAMEFVAYLAGEVHSDAPICSSPVLAAFGRGLNDCMPDEERQSLRPLLTRVIGTAGDGQDEQRVWMVRDWIIRRYLPTWLRLAGFTDYADRLANHDAILSDADLEAVMPIVSAAGSAAWSAADSAAGSAAWSAAWSAADSAAGSAAWSAARSAAWSAAGSAAGSAARSAMGSAARSAAGSAAWSAAKAELMPTVDTLRAEARQLFEAMLDPGGIHDVDLRSEEEYLAQSGRTLAELAISS